MKIAITGSNGYIASSLIVKLESVGHYIVRIKRDDLYNRESLEKNISGVDTIIHLAGSPIFRRWTKSARTEIMNSRTIPANNLVDIINGLPADKRPNTFISSSAIGIYRSGQIHTENSTEFSDGFAANVVSQWEKASENLDHSVRRIIFRIGVVIGKESQTIKKLLPIFKSGLGGKIATGKQAFPFVHIDDVVNAFFWACQNKEVSGIFNLSAPQNIDNSQFTNELAKKLKRIAIFSVPESALKLIYGEAANMITESPQAYPERLLQYGYRFKFPDIESSLLEIIK